MYQSCRFWMLHNNSDNCVSVSHPERIKMMNEVFNNFRNVPREEVESDHTFRTLRHFPAIAKSVSNTVVCVHENKVSLVVEKKSRSSKQRKSTHRLESLCKSSIGEFNSLSSFRKQIINERHKPHRDTLKLPPRLSAKELAAEDHLQNANDKLTKFSISYDSRKANNDLNGFQNEVLTKEELNIQLKRCLTIYLSDEELDALFINMDADGSGLIDGVEFTRYFFKLGQDARFRMQSETSTLHQQLIDAEKQQDIEKYKS